MNTHNPQLAFQYEIRDKHTGKVKRTYNPPNPVDSGEVILNIEYKDGDGNILHTDRKPMKSFVSNFARILNYAYMAVDNKTGATSPNLLILTTSGGAGSAGTACHTMDVTEAALTDPSQSSYGTWIGDMDDDGGFGLTAEAGIGNVLAYDDYMLRRQILAASAGAGWDTFMEHRIVNVSISGNTLTISRKFQNDHASSTHSINEIGLVGKDNSGDYFLITRDVFQEEGNVDLAATKVLDVKYQFTITNASGLTKNWLRQLSSDLSGGNAKEQPKDINGSGYTVDFSTARTQKIMNAADNISTHGIVVGGNIDGVAGVKIAALSTDGFALSSPLVDTDIDYGPVTAIAMTQTNNYTTFGLYRDFENDRSDDKSVHITEAALYIYETSGTHYFMLARNVINNDPAEIVILKDEILRVKATWKFELEP